MEVDQGLQRLPQLPKMPFLNFLWPLATLTSLKQDLTILWEISCRYLGSKFQTLGERICFFRRILWLYETRILLGDTCHRLNRHLWCLSSLIAMSWESVRFQGIRLTILLPLERVLEYFMAQDTEEIQKCLQSPPE